MCVCVCVYVCIYIYIYIHCSVVQGYKKTHQASEILDSREFPFVMPTVLGNKRGGAALKSDR